MPDGLQTDVETMISRHAFQSSSSENEADEMVDSPSEMTILRPKLSRRKIRINSDKSYGRFPCVFIFCCFAKLAMYEAFYSEKCI